MTSVFRRQTNMADLPDKVRQFIEDKQLIPESSEVIAAVSGGADSLALLLILHQLQQPLSFQLSCIHIHHGLRGAEADEDQQFVAAWCKKLNVPLVIKAVDVRKQSADSRKGIELVARDLRRQIFQTCLKQRSTASQPVFVALAHHLDDQAETLLMHLGRGSGLDGLAGMKAKDGSIIRPLLHCRRSELEQWLEFCSITWRHDPTNDDDFTIRNRLRHHMLPSWQALLGYDPVPILARASDNLKADQQLIQSLAEQAANQCLTNNHIDRDVFLSLHTALQARVIQILWCRQTGHGQNLEQKHIRAIIRWIPQAKKWQSLDLPERWRIVCIGRIFGFEKTDGNTRSTEEQPFEIPLNIPGQTAIPQCDRVFGACWITDEQDIRQELFEVILAADRCLRSVFRTRRPGDRIRPAGQRKSISLNQWMQQKKLSPTEREQLLLLADGSDIVWIPGYTSGVEDVKTYQNQTENKFVGLYVVPLQRNP